jgi:hypothetical protein
LRPAHKLWLRVVLALTTLALAVLGAHTPIGYDIPER